MVCLASFLTEREQALSWQGASQLDPLLEEDLTWVVGLLRLGVSRSGGAGAASNQIPAANAQLSAALNLATAKQNR
jgi:hypothetical protein